MGPVLNLSDIGLLVALAAFVFAMGDTFFCWWTKPPKPEQDQETDYDAPPDDYWHNHSGETP